MRVHIATDHAGFELKEKIIAHLREAGHDVVDHGAFAYDALDDYPPFCIDAAKAVASERTRPRAWPASTTMRT